MASNGSKNIVKVLSPQELQESILPLMPVQETVQILDVQGNPVNVAETIKSGKQQHFILKCIFKNFNNFVKKRKEREILESDLNQVNKVPHTNLDENDLVDIETISRNLVLNKENLPPFFEDSELSSDSDELLEVDMGNNNQDKKEKQVNKR